MRGKEKKIVLLHSITVESKLIKKTLESKYRVVKANKYYELLQAKSKGIDVVVHYISNGENTLIDAVSKINIHYHSIPKLAILSDNSDVELIRKCGEIDIHRVVLLSDLSELSKHIDSLIKHNTIRVSLKDIGIKSEDSSIMLKKAFFFIEQNYLQLMTVEEVINYLGTTYKTLSTLFKRAHIINPKAILMFLKIRHSLCLLKQSNLSIKEIAYESGFSNEKRFAECFKRMFGRSISNSLHDIRNYSIEIFWRDNLKYKLLY